MSEELFIEGGKRLGVRRSDLGDWFVSHSPRNGNSFAEGPWDHWVDLAIKILQDPLTQMVRPEAHFTVKDLPIGDFYSETLHDLTDDELKRRFGDED
ncbi:hypothetical protein AB0P05_26635 [Streptomyces flaveolus]|uniref:hypothetical protein n=1 Tax=Streptomyces flaveolus TaxID=67297 RepID=UPI003432C74D